MEERILIQGTMKGDLGMEIKTFGVIGAGQMGGGIAQVAAASGLP
jgi:phosphoglycerate dehydrogenase-like enzyme